MNTTATLVPDAGATLDHGTLTPDRIRAEALVLLPDAGTFHVGPRDIGAGIRAVDDFLDYDRDALAAWIVDVVTAQATAAYAAGLAAATTAEETEFARVAEMATAAGDAQASGEFAGYLGQLSAVLRQGHTLASQHDLARTLDVEAAKLTARVAATLQAYPALAAAARTPSLVLPTHLE